MRAWAAVLALLAGGLLSGRALGGDLAEEADLEFQFGKEAYARADYRSALRHFLASNRLVPNRNVTFNIARTEEQLHDWPAAWRYYAAALEGETHPEQRARIDEAMARVLPNVVVLEVGSEPPGARVYIERKDLGLRGVTPLELGLSKGRYRLLLEADGYHSASVDLELANNGERQKLRVALEPVLGVIVILGAEPGLGVRIDSPASPPVCHVPCRLERRPGLVSVWVTHPSRKPRKYVIRVVAGQTATLRPELESVTGRLVVRTDEPGALVTVDGEDRGFTPAVITLPVGAHVLRVSRDGYFPVTRRVAARRDGVTAVDLELTEATPVHAASRNTEVVEEAPSSVSIVSSHELRSMAYPTLAEAVRGVRGVQLSDDRSYIALGMRGLSSLGSYGNRVLVLVDGQPTNDDWIGSSAVGYDFRTDLGDVQRIEVVRGPGSVLYGTNAVSGVINVVTRRPGGRARVETGVSAVGSGVGRVRLRAESPLGKHGGLWSSVATSSSLGDDFQFPEYAGTPNAGSGASLGADGARTGTLAGGASSGWLRASWQLHTHTKRVPTGEYDTLLGDPRTRQEDTRAFLELSAEPEIGTNVRSLTRLHLNTYRFRGSYARPATAGGVEYDNYDGFWVGLEQRLSYEPSQALRLSVGGETQGHLIAREIGADRAGTYLDSSHPHEVAAVYALADAKFAEGARAALGTRVDHYSTFGTAVNPRASLLFEPWQRGLVKLLFGRAFRAPSPYELYYTEGADAEAGRLKPEVTYSAEAEVTERFSATTALTFATYANAATDLIVARGAGVAPDPFGYVNSSVPVVTLGGELELRRSLRRGWTAAVTYGLSRSLFLKSNSLSDVLSLAREPGLREVSNVPLHSASVFGAAPLGVGNLTVASRWTFEGARWDRMVEADDPPQERTSDAVLWDVVLTGGSQRFDLAWALGIYNAFGARHAVPVSSEFRQRTIPQAGRTLLLTVEKTLR